MKDGDRMVLFVDPEDEVADRYRSYTDKRERVSVTEASTVSGARDRLADEPIACLVVDADPLGEEGIEFVAEARTIAPECPIVFLTENDTSDLPVSVHRHAATIVERTDDAGNLAFLAEKIESALRATDDQPGDTAMYRELVEAARDGLYRLDANGRVVYANESFAEMFGYDREEIIGGHAAWSMAEGELERGQRIIQQVLEADDSESDIIDMEMETKEGETITVAIHFSILTTEDGTYDGVVGVARDVTDRRERERELERKNDRLEEFASVVSHDLRSPLTVAEGRLGLAQQKVDSEHLAEVGDALDRMNGLIDDLLALARKGDDATQVEPLALDSIVTNCWQHVATVETSLECRSSRRLRADRGRLKQLLENLFTNAVDHAGDDPRVVVGELDDGFYVADDGPGIPADARESIFEAGYSTDEDGTGFGLAIVKEIVADHGWKIAVTDSEMGGARFEISGVDIVDE